MSAVDLTPAEVQRLIALALQRPSDQSDQTDAVYEAESEAELHLADALHIDPPNITPDDLEAFVARAMAGAGWIGDNVPVFALDVPDESDRAGWHAGADGVIHLHPKLLSPFIVLHELAHWLRPRDNHGPQFAGTYVGLLRAALGEDVADVFLTTFNEYGVEVETKWAEVS